MPNTKRGFGSAGIIIVILIIVAGGAYFWSQKKAEAPVPTNVVPTDNSFTTLPAPDETANWKTYRSDKYGYEINYPPQWEAIHPGNDGDIWLSEPMDNSGVWGTGGIEIYPPKTISDLVWWYYPEKDRTLAEYISETGAKKIVLNNMEFLKTPEHRRSAFPCGSKYVIEKSQQFFEIIVYGDIDLELFPNLVCNDSTPQIDSQQIRDILSTFRFVK